VFPEGEYLKGLVVLKQAAHSPATTFTDP
jgi:hypothetical protein